MEKVIDNIVKINGTEFNVNVSYTKPEFFERFKNKIKYPFDCEETYQELIKYIPKPVKKVKESE